MSGPTFDGEDNQVINTTADATALEFTATSNTAQFNTTATNLDLQTAGTNPGFYLKNNVGITTNSSLFTNAINASGTVTANRVSTTEFAITGTGTTSTISTPTTISNQLTVQTSSGSTMSVQTASNSSTSTVLALRNNGASNPGAGYLLTMLCPNQASGQTSRFNFGKDQSNNGGSYTFRHSYNTTLSNVSMDILQFGDATPAMQIYKSAVTGTTATSGSVVVNGDLAASQSLRSKGLVMHGSVSGSATINPPSSIATPYTLTLPTSLGTVGQYLTLGTPSGNTAALSWTTGTGTSPSGMTSLTLANTASFITVSGSPTSGNTPTITLSATNTPTGSGGVVLATSPTLVTPVLGAATGTSLNVSDSVTLNRLIENQTQITTTLNGTTTLDSTSATSLILLGGQTGYSVVFPDATTLPIGIIYKVMNNATTNVTLKNTSGTTIGIATNGTLLHVALEGNATANGNWDIHGLLHHTAVASSDNYLQLKNGTQLSIANTGSAGTTYIYPSSTQTTDYNFILPTTSGTAGQILTSGGGSSPMTWSSAIPSTTVLNLPQVGHQLGSTSYTTTALTITSNTNTSDQPLLVKNSLAGNTCIGAFYSDSIGNGQTTELRFGRAFSSMNSIGWKFNYVGAGSNSNYLSMNFSFIADSLRIYKDSITATSSDATLKVQGGLNATNIYTAGSLESNSITTGNITSSGLVSSAKTTTNTFVESAGQNTTSLNGTLTLTNNSNTYQYFIGTATGYSIVLPNATTLTVGQIYKFNNQSSQTLTIKNAGATTLSTIAAGMLYYASVENISSANGTWDIFSVLPDNIQPTNNGFILKNNSQLALRNASNYTTYITTASTGDYNFILPATSGTAGQFLTSGGGGALGWSSSVPSTTILNLPAEGHVLGAAGNTNNTLKIFGGNDNTTQTLWVANGRSSGNVGIASFFSYNLANGNSQDIKIGKENSDMNRFIMRYNHVGDGSISNYMSFNLSNISGDSVQILSPARTASASDGTLKVIGGLQATTGYFSSSMNVAGEAQAQYFTTLGTGTSSFYNTYTGSGTTEGIALMLNNNAQNSPTVLIQNDLVSQNTIGMTILNPSLSVANAVQMQIGKNTNTGNLATVGFSYGGNNNVDNQLFTKIQGYDTSISVSRPYLAATTFQVNGGMSASGITSNGTITGTGLITSSSMQTTALTCTGATNTNSLTVNSLPMTFTQGTKTPTFWWAYSTTDPSMSFNYPPVDGLYNQLYHWQKIGKQYTFSMSMTIEITNSAQLTKVMFINDTDPPVPFCGAYTQNELSTTAPYTQGLYIPAM